MRVLGLEAHHPHIAAPQVTSNNTPFHYSSTEVNNLNDEIHQSVNNTVSSTIQHQLKLSPSSSNSNFDTQSEPKHVHQSSVESMHMRMEQGCPDSLCGVENEKSGNSSYQRYQSQQDTETNRNKYYIDDEDPPIKFSDKTVESWTKIEQISARCSNVTDKRSSPSTSRLSLIPEVNRPLNDKEILQSEGKRNVKEISEQIEQIKSKIEAISQEKALNFAHEKRRPSMGTRALAGKKGH